MPVKLLTAADLPSGLRDHISYDPDTGIFYRIKCRYASHVGRPTGRINKDGYVDLFFGGRYLQAHRMAWFYVHGDLPPLQIDHINRVRHDNRIANLRLATISQNAANQTAHEGSSSQFKGVCWNKACRKWQAGIKHQGKPYYLGLFESEESAGQAYREAAIRLHGEFARFE